MQYWRSDGDLAGVRGNDALARIPAEERKEWERFWAEVDALIRRASEPDYSPPRGRTTSQAM